MPCCAARDGPHMQPPPEKPAQPDPDSALPPLPTRRPLSDCRGRRRQSDRTTIVRPPGAPGSTGVETSPPGGGRSSSNARGGRQRSRCDGQGVAFSTYQYPRRHLALLCRIETASPRNTSLPSVVRRFKLSGRPQQGGCVREPRFYRLRRRQP